MWSNKRHRRHASVSCKLYPSANSRVRDYVRWAASVIAMARSVVFCGLPLGNRSRLGFPSMELRRKIHRDFAHVRPDDLDRRVSTLEKILRTDGRRLPRVTNLWSLFQYKVNTHVILFSRCFNVILDDFNTSIPKDQYFLKTLWYRW